MIARKGDYGFDTPYVPALLLLGSLPLWVGAVHAALARRPAQTVSMAVLAGFLVACAASYVYTTRKGKLAVWDELLAALPWRGDERVLDVGCGRGAVLLMAADRLSSGGKATGIDLWQAQDQSGNALATTERNAAAEGVLDRVELHTGDMRQLPFADASFDVVLSSLAIHNVPDAAGRAKAVAEIARVVKPGGRVLVADIRYAADYAGSLEQAGFSVSRRGLGLRFWYGGPWMATTLVSATRPS